MEAQELSILNDLWPFSVGFRFNIEVEGQEFSLGVQSLFLDCTCS